MEELLDSVEKARRYMAGYWEGENGWYHTGRPCIADLSRWSPPKVYRTWERLSSHLVRTHPTHVDSGVKTMLYKWVARHHPTWNPDPYLELLIRENVRLTSYALGDRVVGVEFNLRYEDVCATHLFPWEREELGRTNLGKFCLAFEAIRCREEGCRYFAMGKIYPYKEAIFRTALVDFHPQEQSGETPDVARL